MATSTYVSPQEYERRERHLRANTRPYNILDPFTYSVPTKSALAMSGATLALAQFYNMIMRKPWYWGLYIRAVGVAGTFALGYWTGTMREYHMSTKEAVAEHYVNLHPEDFDMFQDRAGRAYSQVLLPWYPFRTHYHINKDDEDKK